MRQQFQDKLVNAALLCDPVTRLPFRGAYYMLHTVTVLKAKKDPQYVRHVKASHKESRKRDGGDNVISLSEFVELGKAQDDARKIEDSLARFPKAEEWLERACYRDFVSAPVKETLWALQRVNRGWDDRSLWSLDSSMSRQLGSQLLALAEISHGWPGSQSEFPTHKDWVTALTKHGNALVTYANFDYLASISDEELYELPTRDDFKKRHATQKIITKQASAAFKWVAQNLESLWD